MAREHAVDYKCEDNDVSLLKKKDHLIMVITKEAVNCGHIMTVTWKHKRATELTLTIRSAGTTNAQRMRFCVDSQHDCASA